MAHLCVPHTHRGHKRVMGPLEVLGEGITDCTSLHCSDPVTEFALKGTVMLPLTPWKIVAMATRRFNELMNHSGTPRLRRISVSLREQREGEKRWGQDSIETHYRVWSKQSKGPRWPIVPKCSESEFGQGSS